AVHAERARRSRGVLRRLLRPLRRLERHGARSRAALLRDHPGGVHPRRGHPPLALARGRGGPPAHRGKIVVLTSSYPRPEADYAGRFAAGAIERLRERGVEVELLAPGRGFRDFGLAYGGGVVHNLRRRPWLAPPAFASVVQAVRRASASADLVHAHW